MKIFNITFRHKAARKMATRNHFSDLPFLLDQIRQEICQETSILRASGNRICVSAAFAFEAMQNEAAENDEAAPARVNRLEGDLVANHRQVALLEQQERFIAAMRSLLDEFISGQQAPGHTHAGEI